MTVDQISVFVENTPGKLVEVLETLAAADVDLRALSIADSTDFGILRLIADKMDKALSVLREAEYITTVNKVIAASVEDKPGSLARILRLLSDAGISVEYAYAFITHEPGRALVIVRVEDNKTAIDALTKNGVVLVGDDSIRSL